MFNFNFKIWQFVRIMVEFEDSKKTHKEKNKFRNNPIYKDWRNLWLQTDQKLESLNQKDHRAFSKKMMIEEISLDFRSKAQLNEVITCLDRVINKIKFKINKSENNQDIDDLNFEKIELRKLKNILVNSKNNFIT